MNQWSGFLKKEWIESIKSYKLLLIVTCFSFLGILNPFTAKITPVLFEKFLPEIMVSLPEPSALDSWLQFHKNVPQTGMIFFILLFSTIVSKELEKGTLTMLLTKGLSRSTVITTKFFIISGYWIGAISLSFLITYGYTAYYWDQGTVHHTVFAAFGLLLVGLLLLSITLWGNTFFANSSGGVIAALLAFGALSLAAIIPTTIKWNPIALLTEASNLLTNMTEPKELWLPCLVAIGSTASFVCWTVRHFKKKQI